MPTVALITCLTTDAPRRMSRPLAYLAGLGWRVQLIVGKRRSISLPRVTPQVVVAHSGAMDHAVEYTVRQWARAGGAHYLWLHRVSPEHLSLELERRGLLSLED